MRFHPVGDLAQWRIIYDEASKLHAGDVITYDELSKLIDRPKEAVRVPLDRAMRELQTEDHKTLVCVRGVGYRVAAATEHEKLAHKHTVRSRRQIGRALARAQSADRSALTPDQARRIDSVEATLTNHAALLNRLSTRVEERAEELRQLRRDTSTNVAHLSEQFENMRATLARHGITLPTEAEE